MDFFCFMDIKNFLKANGLKQKDLVNYLNISRAYASQLAKGTAGVSAKNLSKLLSNPYGWDTSMLVFDNSTIINSSAYSENGTSSIRINNNTKQSSEDVNILKAEIDSLKALLAEEKQRSAQYWEMIQKLMK